ncbi:MAG: glycoside hydrolase family 2 [Bacteroidales bacterium]|jgi:hypothetical protein|nr:glycoside hydrolase family 2 [Bacteroidales bacterium]
MNKCLLLAVTGLLSATLLLSCDGISNGTPDGKLSKGFVNPPDSMQTGVYWYWISDNISKNGVVKDLHAMKEAGINRAFIGNIGQGDIPYGNVKMFSDEWWDILHTALKTATELDIEIGIFNSPGWSQSGGPWVKPEEAMRYLAASEIRVKGPQKLSQKLPLPVEGKKSFDGKPATFQDVKVIAYPAPSGKVWKQEIRTSFKNEDDEYADRSFTFTFEKPETLRSISITPVNTAINALATVSVPEPETGNMKTVAEFAVNRTNRSLNVGFIQDAPVTVNIPEVTTESAVVSLTNNRNSAGFLDIELSSLPRIERYSEKTLAKMHQTPLPYWHDYMWPQQPEQSEGAINPATVVDLSDKLRPDGTFHWDVPDGEWVIMRTGMTPTNVTNSPASPESTGFETDKMSRKHIETHFYGHIGEILKRIPAKDRKTFRIVVEDSYETGGENFTDGFIEDFRQRYGYDPVPYLPAYQGYVIGNKENSDRFLWDVRRLVADKIAYDYVGGLRDVSHQHGLTTWLECYGHWGFPSEFLMYGGQSDEIAGEFWSEGSLGDIENRAASSCGHIYGKTKISAESNTCGGGAYSRYPAVIKQRGDRFFSEGINNTLLHVYITQPYEEWSPGVNAGFGNEFNRKNTWFSQIDVYTRYLKRVNYMLQQGLNVADVAYFIGEDAPKMTGVTDPPLPAGSQFDYMNAEVIEKYMTVKDGLITLPHGTQYRILVLPKLETMRPEVLQRIRDLVNDGATVLGAPPRRSPSLQNQPAADEQVQKLAAELWGNVDGVNVKHAKFGKGIIINGLNLAEAFELIGNRPDCYIPELQFANGAPAPAVPNNTVLYGHRTLEGAEIYFLSNQANKTVNIPAVWFRVANRKPELWHPVTGQIRWLPAFRSRDGLTGVPLRLEPYESVFIVFRKKATSRQSLDTPDAIAQNFPAPSNTTDITGSWTVAFEDRNPIQRGLAEPVKFDSLFSWTKSDVEAIKHYSGTARYSKTFTAKKPKRGQRLYLDLGALTAMAKVYLNGQYIDGVWTTPYRVDISDAVKNGDNQLEVAVVNTWVNRLVGDAALPNRSRPTWTPRNPYHNSADTFLQPSGLFGPVKLLTFEW